MLKAFNNEFTFFQCPTSGFVRELRRSRRPVASTETLEDSKTFKKEVLRNNVVTQPLILNSFYRLMDTTPKPCDTCRQSLWLKEVINKVTKKSTEAKLQTYLISEVRGSDSRPIRPSVR